MNAIAKSLTAEFIRQDGWVNTTTGIGGPLDKSSGFAFLSNFVHNDSRILEAIYDEDHTAGKIVDAPVDAAFKRGYQLNIQDPAIKREAVIDALEVLQAEYHLGQALRWERLYGGAAVMLGAADGKRLDEPLEGNAIQQFHYLNAYNRWELSPHTYYSNPLHPKFGQPQVYRLHPQSTTTSIVGALVHESRFLLFKGRPTTKTTQILNQYWGNSFLMRCFSAVKQHGAAMASVLAAMADASQAIYKIKGLHNIIKGGNETPLKTRMRVIDEVRSVVNAIVLDSDGEDFTKLSTQLTELANLVDRFKLNLASAAEMPMTVLFGQAPAGLNATGESDMALWYDSVSQYQTRVVAPAMERIARLVMRAKFGPTAGVLPEKWSVTFPSPWVPTPKEKAELRRLQAEEFGKYFDMRVLTAQQIAKARFGGSGDNSEGEITLSEAEILAVPNDQPPAMTPEEQSLILPPAAAQDDEDEFLEDLDALDIPTPSEPLSLIEARALAAKMTEHNVERCNHQKMNSCRICGLKKVQDFSGVDSTGAPIWVTKWRAIDESAPPMEDPLEPKA